MLPTRLDEASENAPSSSQRPMCALVYEGCEELFADTFAGCLPRIHFLSESSPMFAPIDQQLACRNPYYNG